ncbi:MAG: aromatic amino acid lyase, partial [Nanoarchaeota archaeon]|nr:aromatic amino acid lyase [Nanoarchaeota archaeon]
MNLKLSLLTRPQKEHKFILITGNNLTISDVVKVARHRYRVQLSDEAKARINCCRSVVDQIVRNNGIVYGLTTGFGSLANVTISQDKTEELQKNLIMSHAVGVGRPLSEEIVRAIMLLRVNTFAKGFSGIRLSTVQTLVDMLNGNVCPVVPEKGSVGS